MSRARPRLGLASTAFGLVAASSYVLQRLYAASSGVEGMGVAVATKHIPYYWRCDLALIHGVLAAVLVGFAVSDDDARRWFGRLPYAVPVVVGACVVAMLVVP
ncbi:MAG: hypothetical protein H6733_15980 [Alphaproteobacteria bacterium]|nr:hypothetical protein [Alphaproteobacteria bacterium]